MQRKFECLNCHCQFEADDQTMVKCPKCGTDNVDIAHFHLPKGWWKWVLLIAVVAGVSFLLTRMDWKEQDTPQETITPAEPLDTTEIIGIDSCYIDEDAPKIDAITTVKVGKPVYADKSYTLAFTVVDAPAQKFYVALLEHNGNQLIKRSEDGKSLRDIPASEKDGLFDIAVFLAANDSMISTAQPVGGFENRETVKEQMTKERLQALLNDPEANLTGAQDWIASDYRLHFTGLSADDKKPKTLSDVQTQIDMLWDDASIADIKYDDKNRITDIYINVQK